LQALGHEKGGAFTLSEEWLSRHGSILGYKRPVSLPGQIAAVAPLRDPDYYAARYRETHALREHLVADLHARTFLEAVPSVANFVLCHLPPDGPDAATVCTHCRAHGVYLRDAANMSRSIGAHALRIAVKDAETNRRLVDILARVLDPVL
jgi:histidinol-phosphate/aromatic aminotransferase/cobyric acid decarboxylase-like protein